MSGNFERKKLRGSMLGNGEFGGKIGVNGEIRGKKFEEWGGREVKGGLFGKNGAEVGGGFCSGNRVGGLVGWKK